MNERFPSSIEPPKPPKEPPKEGGVNYSRRKFLGDMAKAAVGLTVGLTVGGIGCDLSNEDKNKNQTEGEPIKIKKEDEQVSLGTIEEQLKKGNKITLNENARRNTYEKWRQNYSPGGKDYSGLKQALEEMRPWINEIKAVFKRHGIPEKFAYLCIPESHFSLDACSPKGAGGPFQFMPGTAKDYDLAIGNNLDERRDPIKSAEACARYLKKSYLQFNDWSLALADYNGGYADKYAAFRENKNERSYADYLAWRERRLNEFVSRPFYEHQVEKKDGNLSNIAKKYGLSVEELKKFNVWKEDIIKIGQRIKLPPIISVKLEKLRDSQENLDYPEKFYAVWDVIESNKMIDKYPPISLKYKIIEIPKIKASVFTYIIKKGDTLSSIAKKIHSQAKKINPKAVFSVLQIKEIIQKQNNIRNPKRIRSGQSIEVKMHLEKPMTLSGIALRHNVTKDKMKKLNPAVIDPDEKLPEGTKIRVPFD